MVGGLSAIGAGLYGLGIPKDSIFRYESALKPDKFVLISHGATEEVSHEKTIIKHTNPEMLEHHH